MKLLQKENQFQNQVFQNPSEFLLKNCNHLVLTCVSLTKDDQEVELRDLDEGMDEDVIHVDDLEKAREKSSSRG